MPNFHILSIRKSKILKPYVLKQNHSDHQHQKSSTNHGSGILPNNLDPLRKKLKNIRISF